MIIENKELLELLEKELEITEGLKGAKEEVAQLTARMAEIQEEHKDQLEESKVIRNKIAHIFVPIVMEAKGDFETFDAPEIVDGKVSVKLIDNRPKTLEDAENDLKERIKEIDESWMKHLDK